MVPIRSAFEILTAKLNTLQHAVACVTNQYSYTAITVALGATYLLGAVSYAVFLSPLRNIPGSFIRRLTLLKYYADIACGIEIEKAESGYRRYGDIYLLGPNHVAICNPADCRRLLNSQDFKKTFHYQAFAVVGDNMLTMVSNERNNEMRKLIAPAFSATGLSRMEPAILQASICEIKRKWDQVIGDSQQQGKPAVVNYYMDVTLAAFDVIARLCFGEHSHYLRDSDWRVVNWVENFNIMGVAQYLFKPIRWFPFRLFNSKLERSLADLLAFANRAIQKRTEYLSEHPAQSDRPSDILQTMMGALEPDAKIKMARDELHTETIGMLTGGTGTISQTLTWAIHYLTLYPRVYQKAVAEVRGQFASDHLVTYRDGRQHLPYLEAVLYEVIRIRGVTSRYFPRIVPEGGATFCGHHLSGGTVVYVNIAALHIHADIWEEPEKFIPERFVDNEDNRRKIMIFNPGVRVCPGRNLAWLEMITTLGNLLKDYDLRVPDDSLFGPDNVDSEGVPLVMPRIQIQTTKPMFPERDCRVAISKHA
ncbi:cytochrome P450 [Martensiomyces pterosporus]|nr:cytochrome P450 [Martensiomyces pterosporus]